MAKIPSPESDEDSGEGSVSESQTGPTLPTRGEEDGHQGTGRGGCGQHLHWTQSWAAGTVPGCGRTCQRQLDVRGGMGGLDVLRAEVPRGHFSRLEIPDTAGVRASACRAMLLGLSQLLVSHPLTRRQGDSEKLCHLPKATELVLVAPAYECVCVCAQSCLSLCGPVDCSQPGSSLHRIFQARILEWGAIPYSKGSSQPRDQISSLMSPGLAGGLFPLVSSGKPAGYGIEAECPLHVPLAQRIHAQASENPQGLPVGVETLLPSDPQSTGAPLERAQSRLHSQ